MPDPICYIVVRTKGNVRISEEQRPPLVALPEHCPNEGCGAQNSMLWEPFGLDPQWCWWTCSSCGYGVMFRCPEEEPCT
jgi:hypothetical protein